MGKMSELNAQGVTDLHSYGVGRQDREDEIVKILSNLKVRVGYQSQWNDALREAIDKIQESSNATE